MRDEVEARELREGAEDFADACEAVDGRADRATTLPGMLNYANFER